MLPGPFELEGGNLVGKAVQDQDKVPRPACALCAVGAAVLEDAVVLPQAAMGVGGEADVGLVRMTGGVEGAEAVAVKVLAGCRRGGGGCWVGTCISSGRW